jgi:hypothetical protein
LTGYNYSGLYTTCATNQTGNDAFYYATGYGTDNTAQNYFATVRDTTALLAIWLPIANAERPSSISNAVAGMMCVTPSNISEGSVVPAEWPEPAPEDSNGLSGGAIAGIVVGIIAVVALLVGGLVFWWLRKRRAKKNQYATVEKDIHTLSAGSEDIQNGVVADGDEC